MTGKQVGNFERYNFVADAVAALLAVLALALVGLRAMLRLELRWDTFWYHIPFAARRGGLGIPYVMPDYLQHRFEGFPPLPHFIEGVLWRVTGSINATGVVNYLALVLFLYFCHRKLGARFWIVAIVSLTAPLVLIHAASSYVDLFGNALLAIGTSAFVAMYLFDRFDDRSLLLWGMFGLVGAAWSKYQVIPVVGAFLVCFLVIYGLRLAQPKSRQLFLIVLIAALVASAPFIKNLVYYHNPFWPLKVPIFGKLFPYIEGSFGGKPAPLASHSEFQLFFRSLLETNNPTYYPNRPRWVIDQGNTIEAYRMGGFWNVAVVTAIGATGLLAVLFNRRKGFILLGSTAALLCFLAVLPRSYDIRYYQFLPLTLAATIAMLLPRIRRRYPAVALTVVGLLLAEFVYVSNINRPYYWVERRGYLEAARLSAIPEWWAKLERGKVYCAVKFGARTVMLTGPTMSEYHIINPGEQRCPPNVTALQGDLPPARVPQYDSAQLLR
jgi:hypothetical protein